ncbi:MAG: phosphotransferase [Anaerolineae bacterium]|jgi:Ser/Thr protein kinase RdoA (MazF antagonist)|nr:phosphotransferase [Anaerolineae bacterium]
MDSTLLTLAARHYDLTPDQLRPMRGGNFAATYGFTRGGTDYVLKISPPDPDLDVAAMEAIWAWVHVLDAHGASVAGPIPSMAGHLVETIEQEAGTYLVTALKKAPGILAEELPYEEWSDALFRAWGRTAGKMHAIAESCVAQACAAHASPAAEAALRRPEWDQARNYFSDPLPEALVGTPIEGAHARERAYLDTLPRDSTSYGMIHMDFHAANFFVEPETTIVTVFDFDDCMRGWYAMDIAMALFDVLVVYPREDRLAFAEHFLMQYLAGYGSEKPLDAFWIAQLPHFLKLLEIGVYAEVYPYHDPSDTTSWVGKFLADDRKGRIERGEPYVDVDFPAILASVNRATV